MQTSYQIGPLSLLQRKKSYLKEVINKILYILCSPLPLKAHINLLHKQISKYNRCHRIHLRHLPKPWPKLFFSWYYVNVSRRRVKSRINQFTYLPTSPYMKNDLLWVVSSGISIWLYICVVAFVSVYGDILFVSLISFYYWPAGTPFPVGI